MTAPARALTVNSGVAVCMGLEHEREVSSGARVDGTALKLIAESNGYV